MRTLSPDFQLRSATWDDLDGVTQLIKAACAADGDAAMAVSPEELALEWKTPGFSLETDAWVVTNPEGMITGYEEFNNRFAHASLQGDGYVHPDYLGLGIGSSLLERLDARAQQEVALAEPGLRVFIRNGIGSQEINARTIHDEAGFKAIRYSWRMEITFENQPEKANWPQNITLRPFELDNHNFLLHQAHESAFGDHWGHTPHTFEHWQTNISGHPDFDPQLWFVAWDGEQMAGYALCRSRQGIGWVGTLGVLRPWRKQGLGMALLQHSFRELYQRGYSTIGLTVDASNPTGATRLYERAGMHQVSEFIIYEKEYRPGREPQE